MPVGGYDDPDFARDAVGSPSLSVGFGVTFFPMSTLFAAAFARPVEEKDGKLKPTPIYNEARRLSLLPDGRVCVEASLNGETVTFTKASGEADDSDVEDDRIITEVRGEVDAWTTGSVAGLETKARPETDIWPLADLGTRTSVRSESDDFQTAPSGGDDESFTSASTIRA
jgi:hypothetical protein